MIARFPSRFKMSYVLLYAVLLCTFELMQGSDPQCVGCVFLFILIGGDAFNRAGGLMYPSGSYVFFFALLTLLVGAMWKVRLGEPLDGNMVAPQLTLLVYLGGMAAVWVAAVVNVRLRTKKPLLNGDIPVQHQLRAAMGCLIAGISLNLLSPLFVKLGIASILHQLDFFYPLAIMLAVYYRVRQTGGERSISGVAVAAAFVSFFIGVLSFSKQGLFTPFVGWAFGALAVGYKTSWKQIFIIAAGVGVGVTILVPYSQYGRHHRDEFSNPFQVMALMVTDPEVFTEKADIRPDQAPLYRFYNEPQGLMDRLTMLKLDDPLILRSNLGHYQGWVVMRDYVVNTLPHFILPDKPTLRYGNLYAHEIGVLSRRDFTTGISFSAPAEAFHIAGWFGLFTAMPAVLLFLFWVTDSLVGSLRDGPWALFFILIFSHLAPEGGLGSPIYFSTYGVVMVIFSTFMARRVAPLVGTMLMGPGKVPMTTIPRDQQRRAHPIET